VTVATGAAVSPWTGRHARTTTGIFALMFLFAFEALAVAAVMPDVAAELEGLRWYAVAFAAPMAASVVALVVAGPAIDRRGPGPALVGGLVVFCAGVVLAGLAPTMPVFLVGRLVHGLGAGVLGVALYVVVAQAYPEQLRARVFAVLTAAWVLPALVGPVVAASVAHAVGWRWVFLGVPVLAVGAWLLVRSAPSRPGDGNAGRPRLGAALLAATGVLVVSIAGQRALSAWPVLVVAGIIVIVVAGGRLLPAGSWSGRRGLPSVIGARGLIGTAFAAAEVYLPLLLTLTRDLTLAEAGWVLTTGAVSWCAGAWLAARWRVLSDETVRVRVGAALLAAGVGGFALVALPAVPLAVPVLCWAVAGIGVGMSFSTLSVLALAFAPPGEEGRTSSALQLNDYLVQSAALAVGSVAFAGFATGDPVLGATLLVIAATLIGGLALVPASRLRA
jgi:MFS family permease